MTSAALLILALTPGLADPIFGSGFDDPEGCPAGRQTVADIDYLGDCVHFGADVTEWSNVFGYSCETGGTVPFPGLRVSPTIMNFGKTTYIAMHLHVPSDFPNAYGWIVHTEYDYGADLTTSFSTNCGDFAPTNPVCATVSVSGQPLTPWRAGSGGFCPLTPDADYFFNVKFTNPNGGSTTCDSDAPSCAVGLSNNFSGP